MKTRSSWSLVAARLALALSFPALLHAGTGFSISPSNATIDTRGLNDTEVIITMHRVTGEALTNVGAGAGIDEPLGIRGNDPALLDRQPQLPIAGTIYDRFYTPQSGLVADGVTPILFRVSAAGALSGPVSYSVELQTDQTGPWGSGPDLNGRLRILKNGAFEKNRTFTLTAGDSTAYLALDPVQAGELEDNRGGIPAAAIMKVKLLVKTGVLSTPKGVVFGVRKPPVIFVHGYNAGTDTWDESSFLAGFIQDRGADFVIPVGYGNENNNETNTYGTLDTLTGLLHGELLRKVEKRGDATEWEMSGNWAWTRYDAVGHSQGGVLLRLLCNSSGWPFYIGSGEDMRFRQPANHHRGRFHRVVTVGSPHFGSTLAHLGTGILDQNLDFGENLVEWFAPKERLLQSKFRVDQPAMGPNTPQKLNQLFTPDPASRLHLLAATIDQGKIPGPRPGLATLPRIFKAVHLHKGDDDNKVSGKRWGEWIAPFGSDGVVDLRSQMGTTNPNSPPSNASRMSSASDIAHASAFPSTNLPFDTSKTETGDYAVAGALLDLLNGSVSSFGPFPSPSECTALHSEMNTTADAIEQILDLVREMQRPFREKLWAKIGFSPAPFPQSMELRVPRDVPPASVETVNLTLQSPAGESPNGPAVWLVLVYGPNGVTTEGVTLTASGTYGENLQIDIAASVVGEVVASVQFPSSSGKTVIGEAGVVASRPPGVLTGIELRPDAIAMPAGPSLPLEVWGVYDSGGRMRLFTDAANTTWLSNDPAVATVDDEGIVTLTAPGETSVQATYNGVHSADSAIDVWAPPPVITSGAAAAASTGQSFSYQITADGSPVSYTARDLPEGLSFDSASGLISGSPLHEGLFHILVGALNADAQEGSRDVALTVTGTNQAPTAIGMDNGSVPAMQTAGTLVGRLATADVNPLDTFTYALVAGSGAADNGLFTISGDELRTTAIIDPASQPECAIRLRATDSGGLTVEQSLLLPVLGAPVITAAPQGAIVFAGRPYALECEASGREPLLFQWRLDGADIPGAHGRTLEMTAGMPGGASYSVRVENSYGTQTSASATVEVVPLSFGAWASQFTTPESGGIAPDGDLNHDGLSNFLDYAFGTAPGETRRHLPQVRVTPDGPAYVHRRALGIDSAGYHVLASTDMLHWEPYEALPEDLSVTALDTMAEEVALRLPPEPRLFFKMKVDATPPAPAARQSFQTWGWAHGLTLAGMDPLDDPDADGLPNLVEFTFNSKPLIAEAGTQPSGRVVEDAGGNLLSLSHRRNKRAPLSHEYEWSPDLAQWFPFTPILTVPDPDADGDGATELIEARRAIQPGEPSGFLRLKVSEP